jgi:hypothetical protein
VGLAATAVQAHEFYSTKLTWTRDISRIFLKRCAECHREGGTSMDLTSYAKARPWAVAIKDEVLNRRMPPWNAVKGFGDLYDDKSLTQEEISVISNWVEGGAPEGDPAYLPPMPKFDDGMNAGPTAPPVSARLKDTLTLKDPVELFGIMPSGVEPKSQVQVVATRPDGSMVPLLWVMTANPDVQQIYYYSTDISLPAGSKIEMIPPNAGNFAIYWKPAAPPKVTSNQKPARRS